MNRQVMRALILSLTKRNHKSPFTIEDLRPDDDVEIVGE
jgi:hypothetical protein